MGERIADASTPDSRTGEVEALRGPLDPDAALCRLTWTTQSESQLVLLVLEVLNSLDRMLDAPIEERLAVVADRAGECVGAAAFCVSRVDGMTVHARRVVVSRAPRTESGPVAVERLDTYQLTQRPRVAQAAEGSAFSVTLDTGDGRAGRSHGCRLPECGGRRWLRPGCAPMADRALR